MSIINEALKKTQSNLDGAEEPKQTGRFKASPSTIATSIFILIVTCGLAVVYFLSGQKNTASSRTYSDINKTAAQLSSPSPAARKITKIVSALPQATASTLMKKENTLILKGIIRDKEIPLALINNEILKAGDTIDGKKIVRILDDSVEIFDEGEMKILNINR